MVIVNLVETTRLIRLLCPKEMTYNQGLEFIDNYLRKFLIE